MRTVPTFVAMALAASVAWIGMAAPVRAGAMPAAASASSDGQPQSERARFVQLTLALEADPMHADAEENRQWMIGWLQQVPDLEVVVCDLLGATKLPKAQQETASLVFVQYMFGSASYQIEHPGSGPLDEQVQMAGVRSALKSYLAMRAHQQAPAIASFDALAAQVEDGSLESHLKPKIASACKKPGEPTSVTL
jgi:hypothetical protein